MRAVCDTNVFISALVFGGKPRRVLQLAGNGLVLIVSEPLLQELRRVLTTKFGWAEQTLAPVIREITRSAEFVTPGFSTSECRDPDDNRILEAALAGEANVILSGDGDLLSMRFFRGIQILTVGEFLDLIDRQG